MLLAHLLTLVLGFLSWEEIGGTGLVLLAPTFALVVGFFLKRRGWRVSLIAGACGALIAGWFAVASVELFAPASIEWVMRGGLYGAAFGAVVSLILSPLGWIPVRVGRSLEDYRCRALIEPDSTPFHKTSLHHPNWEVDQ